MTIKGTAPSKFILEWTGSAHDFIILTDRHSFAHFGIGLDSMDLGDSLGYWEYFLRNSGTDEMVLEFPNGILRMNVRTELFEWEGNTDE